MAALSKSFSPLDVIIRIRSGRKQDGAGVKQQPDLDTAHPVSTVTSTAIGLLFLGCSKGGGHWHVSAPNDPDLCAPILTIGMKASIPVFQLVSVTVLCLTSLQPGTEAQCFSWQILLQKH